MVDIDSTTYQQFFVPFGALIPRSLPAQGSGGNACPTGSNPKCQAPKFVPANALAIQFSWYGPMDTPGFLTPNPVGSYNVLIDDVAFYKRSALPSGMSDLPALPSSGGAHPLTDNPTINSRCTKPAGANPRLLALAYDNWKKRFVVADSGGFKVIRPENGNDTVSEGIAYGMMIAVYFDDKPLFDGLYKYWNGPRRDERPDDLVHPGRRRQLLGFGRHRDGRRRRRGVRDARWPRSNGRAAVTPERPRR